MFITKPNLKSLKKLIQQLIIPNYTQKATYVDVKMKWKKDSFFDNIETIYKSQELKPIIALKNCIVKEADKCIPISAVSKRGLELDVPIKVAKFLRQYPSIFQEFVGPEYNLPWFRLTKEAVELHNEEELVYRERREDIVDGLKRLILMSEGRKLPLKIVKGMQWYLGLPDEYLKDPEGNLGSSFSLVDMGDGLRGLSVDSGEKVLSTLQRNAVKRGVCLDDSWMPLAFPLYPSKGLRLKVKISNWLDEFQKLPYVSPYEDCSNLNRSCEVFEKRVLGVLHELLSLFVDHSAERKKILCLRTYLDLPQKFYKAFDRHPHIFYLSLRNKTCTAILKEAYDHDSAIDAHPVLNVREKYIRLMKKSDAILKTRRQKNSLSAELGKLNTDVDKDCAAGNIGEALVFDL